MQFLRNKKITKKSIKNTRPRGTPGATRRRRSRPCTRTRRHPGVRRRPVEAGARHRPAAGCGHPLREAFFRLHLNYWPKNKKKYI